MPGDLPWEGLPRPRRAPWTRAALVVDARCCVGCHACAVACKTEHDVALGGFRIRTHYVPRPDRPTHAFLPLMCLHCQDAPCLAACPERAITRGADGRVLIDDGRCEGHGACVTACPYGAIHLDPQTGKADKCDLCRGRHEAGLEPACVEVCPSGALRVGDLGDPASEASRYAAAHEARPFRPEHGTRPAVLHVGLEAWLEQGARTVQLHPDDNDVVYARGAEQGR